MKTTKASKATASKSARKGDVTPRAKAFAYADPHGYFKAALNKPKATATARATATKTKTVAYDVANHLRTPEEQVAYLNAWLEDFPDDVAGIARAFGDVARARGMSKVADAAGLHRVSLYKALSEDGNPTFATMLKVASALHLTLRLEPPPARARKRQLTPA